MSVDDIVKLLLAGSFSFAIIGISYALIRFVQKATLIMEDVRLPIQNVGSLSDMALEDYQSIRGLIKTVANLASGLNGYLEDPMKIIKSFSKLLRRS